MDSVVDTMPFIAPTEEPITNFCGQLKTIIDKRMGVLGDMCLDINSVGRYSGISRELEGLAIFRVDDVTYCPGGGGNLVMNLATLQIPTMLFGTWGQRDIHANHVDWNRVILEECFRDYSISTAGMCVGPRTPVFGKYFLPMGHHIHRVDLVSEPLAPSIEADLYTKIHTLKTRLHCFIIADYDETGHGPVTAKTVQAVKESGLPVFGTSRERIDLLRGIDWAIINEHEMNLGLNLPSPQEPSTLGSRIQKLKTVYNLGGVVITRGEEGVVVYTQEKAVMICPKRLEGPIDPCGAGDTFLAIFASGILAGHAPEEAVRLGMAGSRAVVKKLFGTGYPTYGEIEEEYKHLFEGEK